MLRNRRLHRLDWLFLLALGTGFTLTVIQASIRRGKLSLPLIYDDIFYIAKAAAWFETFTRDGVLALVKQLVAAPPHSPHSEALGFMSFAVFGLHQWAPYAGNALVVFLLLFVANRLLAGVARWQRALCLLFLLTVPLAAMAVHEFKPDAAAAVWTAAGTLAALRKPLSSSPRRQWLVGAAFGIAFLTKPSVFAVTGILFGGTLGLSAATNRT